MSWKPEDDNNNNKIEWNKQRILLFRKLKKQFDSKNMTWRLDNDENKTLTTKTVETLWNELESSENIYTMTFILDGADSSPTKSKSKSKSHSGGKVAQNMNDEKEIEKEKENKNVTCHGSGEISVEGQIDETSIIPDVDESKTAIKSSDSEKERLVKHAAWLCQQQQKADSEEKEGEEIITIDKAAIESAKTKLDQYKKNKNLASYMNAVDGHITLVSAGLKQFDNTTKKVCIFFLI